MPTETWWNLADDKRDRITTAAMAEFGAKGFSAGSLNVIAREAGIAKGSLFQYFADKLDFFATVCDAGSNAIEVETVGDLDLDAPFFDLLRTLVLRWIDYFREHPVERAMAYAAANEIDRDARAAVRGVANAHYAKALRPIVEQARARGELRADVDADLVVSMVTMVLRHLDSAPFDPNGDPAYAFVELDDGEVDRIALAYVDSLERSFS